MPKIKNYLQDRVVKIGREKGYVTKLDVVNIFGSQKNWEKEMQYLIKSEFFDPPIIFDGSQKWNLKKK